MEVATALRCASVVAENRFPSEPCGLDSGMENRRIRGAYCLHPHPDKAHLVRTYRRYILWAKKSYGSARGLVHYRQIIAIYLWAKAWPERSAVATAPTDARPLT